MYIVQYGIAFPFLVRLCPLCGKSCVLCNDQIGELFVTDSSWRGLERISALTAYFTKNSCRIFMCGSPKLSHICQGVGLFFFS
jgi:hypothetical protein